MRWGAVVFVAWTSGCALVEYALRHVGTALLFAVLALLGGALYRFASREDA